MAPYRIKRLTSAEVLAAAEASTSAPAAATTADAAVAAAAPAAAEAPAAARAPAASSAESHARRQDHKRQRYDPKAPPHGWLESPKGGESICGLCPVKTPLSKSFSTSPLESWTPVECVEV